MQPGDVFGRANQRTARAGGRGDGSGEIQVDRIDLAVTEQQRPAVLQFLAIAHLMSQVVATAPLGDASFELAPVFRPGSAGESL